MNEWRSSGWRLTRMNETWWQLAVLGLSRNRCRGLPQEGEPQFRRWLTFGRPSITVQSWYKSESISDESMGSLPLTSFDQFNDSDIIFQCLEDDSPKSFKIYQIWLKENTGPVTPWTAKTDVSLQNRGLSKSGIPKENDVLIILFPLNLPYILGVNALFAEFDTSYSWWHISQYPHHIPVEWVSKIMTMLCSEPARIFLGEILKIWNLGRFGGNPLWMKLALSCPRRKAIVGDRYRRTIIGNVWVMGIS